MPRLADISYSREATIAAELGVVYWIKCPGAIEDSPAVEPVLDDVVDYAPEAEWEWRGNGPAWAVADFFEQLRREFRRLDFVPAGSRTVIDDYSNHSGESGDGSTEALRKVYREHGWPDLERYRKEDCLRAVRDMLREKYPDLLDDEYDE
ncbi:hypothetical protein PG985_013083 [Apiospora marii]|uniref:Uncharacterized protein n=1 Tax=Apiospora marii TaxID=335849 RepID=A0ABR1RDP3_9PEZI